MIDIKKLNIEYKAAAVFGIGSFLLSVILSMFYGNTAGIIILRSVIFAVIFCAIGFSSLFVMKKYVPEFYDIFNSGIPGSSAGHDTAAEEANTSGDAGSSSAGGNADVSVYKDDKISFALDKTDDTETEADLGTIEDVSSTGTSDKEQDKMFKYEPEIAAQAIRTMMKKDEK